MSKKPSLQDFLRDNPGKGLNDYFEMYGQPEETAPVAQQPIQQDIQQESYVDTPRSYIKGNQKDQSSIDVLNIIASLAMMAAFFLPWVNVEGFKQAEELSTVSGLDMYSLFTHFDLESFSDLSYYTVYIIPLGALIALIGELMRNWAVRIIGQILAISFGVYWGIKLYFLYTAEGIHPEDLAVMDFLQYGYMIAIVGIILLLVDIFRTTFGSKR